MPKMMRDDSLPHVHAGIDPYKCWFCFQLDKYAMLVVVANAGTAQIYIKFSITIKQTWMPLPVVKSCHTYQLYLMQVLLLVFPPALSLALTLVYIQQSVSLAQIR